MKRLLMLFVCLVMAISSVACGSDEVKEEKSRKEKSKEDDSESKKEKKDKKDKKDKDKEAKEETEIKFDVEEEGYCGANLTWQYGNGILKISGSGEMSDFSTGGGSMVISAKNYPWADLRSEIQRVYIDGATNISRAAFQECSYLSYVEMSDSIVLRV